jgi:hypothetical protein
VLQPELPAGFEGGGLVGDPRTLGRCDVPDEMIEPAVGETHPSGEHLANIWRTSRRESPGTTWKTLG